MNSHHRYVAGIAGLCVGNALLAAGYLIDDALLGPFTMLALVGAVVGVVGTVILLYLARKTPESFDFEGPTVPTITLVCGLGSVVAGVSNLTLAVVG